MITYLVIALGVVAVVVALMVVLGKKSPADAGVPAPQGDGGKAATAKPDTPAKETHDPGSRRGDVFLVTAVARTDPGLKRKHNEDAFLKLDEPPLFAVADGMGRHAAGEVASQLATDTVAEQIKAGHISTRSPDPELTDEQNRLLSAILEANQVVFTKANEVDAYHGMGTTIVALLFSSDCKRAAIAHAGDSRCYRLRKQKLELLTTDHTLGAAGIVGGNAALLSKAVGIEENLEPDVQLEHPQPEDLYLLCSDGLSRMVDDPTMQQTLLGERDLEKAAQQLIEAAHKGGGRDNVTVILVRLDPANT